MKRFNDVIRVFLKKIIIFFITFMNNLIYQPNKMQNNNEEDDIYCFDGLSFEYLLFSNLSYNNTKLKDFFHNNYWIFKINDCGSVKIYENEEETKWFISLTPQFQLDNRIRLKISIPDYCSKNERCPEIVKYNEKLNDNTDVIKYLEDENNVKVIFNEINGKYIVEDFIQRKKDFIKIKFDYTKV